MQAGAAHPHLLCAAAWPVLAACSRAVFTKGSTPHQSFQFLSTEIHVLCAAVSLRKLQRPCKTQLPGITPKSCLLTHSFHQNKNFSTVYKSSHPGATDPEKAKIPPQLGESSQFPSPANSSPGFHALPTSPCSLSNPWLCNRCFPFPNPHSCLASSAQRHCIPLVTALLHSRGTSFHPEGPYIFSSQSQCFLCLLGIQKAFTYCYIFVSLPSVCYVTQPITLSTPLRTKAHTARTVMVLLRPSLVTARSQSNTFCHCVTSLSPKFTAQHIHLCISAAVVSLVLTRLC